MATDPVLSSSLTAALVEELAVVMGALVGEAGESSAASGDPAVAWVATSTFEGPVRGALALGLSREDGVALAKAVMGFDDVPEDAAVVDLVKEVAGQAFSALGQRPEALGATLTPAAIVTTPPAAAPSTHVIRLGASLAPSVACWCDVAAAADTARPPAAPPAAAAPLSPPAPAPGRPEVAPPATVAPANLDVILDIDLPLTVRFGRTEMTLDALTRLGPGSVIDLGRSPDDPVEVLVNNRLIARGEVVVVSGNYGVRIQEVVSAADRIRSLGEPA